MKINICLVGNYIEKHIKFNEFKNLVEHYKNIFKNYDFHIYIVIWDTINLELKEKLEEMGKLYIFKMPDIKKILNTNTWSGSNNNKLLKQINDNKGEIWGANIYNIYSMFNLRKKAMNIVFNDNPNSYTFLIRVDMRMSFNNINNWISKNTYNVNYFRCWREIGKTHRLFNTKHHPISDQTSVGETSLIYNFYNITDIELSNLFNISHNGESTVFNRLKQLNLHTLKHSKPDANNMVLISKCNKYKIREIE